MLEGEAPWALEIRPKRHERQLARTVRAHLSRPDVRRQGVTQTRATNGFVERAALAQVDGDGL